MGQLEQKQRRTNAFVDRHQNSKEKLFDIGRPILVFQTKMGSMPEKLRFRWTGPLWIVNTYNGTYQVGTLVGLLPQALSKADSGQSFSAGNVIHRKWQAIDQPVRGGKLVLVNF